MKNKKINVRDFAVLRENGEKIVALTAYDAPTGRLAEEAGVHIVLVGDSLGMTVLGYKNTIPVTVDESLHHCKAVMRGVNNAFVIGDMPFMSYHLSIETAMKNAARYLQEGMVDAVKLEGGASIAPTVNALVNAGVPVLGHIGLLPQKVLTAGGYKITGRTEDEVQRLIEDALALQEAGAFAIVLEGIPEGSARRITEALEISTIGIGAGKYCSGQIQVINDVLGLFSDFVPKHAKKYADLNIIIQKALKEYVSDVSSVSFPTKEHSF
jgi:3-methyl-2-oxobutanoate hydroxymethyltransferase